MLSKFKYYFKRKRRILKRRFGMVEIWEVRENRGVRKEQKVRGRRRGNRGVIGKIRKVRGNGERERGKR